MNRSAILSLLGALLPVFPVAAIGGLATASSVDTWYRTLEKPAFNPPDAAFGPAWTALYLMMALAAWRVVRRGGWSPAATALGLFATQLVLNGLWSVLFFGLRQPEWALFEILLLWLAILLTTRRFFTHDRIAGWLMLPYLAWVSFATLLNASIVQLN